MKERENPVKDERAMTAKTPRSRRKEATTAKDLDTISETVGT